MSADAAGRPERTLATLRNGRACTVLSVAGGPCLASRLDALGIRPGKRLVKLSGGILNGPVTVQVGSSRVAMGHGMAARVLVEETD